MSGSSPIFASIRVLHSGVCACLNTHPRQPIVGPYLATCFRFKIRKCGNAAGTGGTAYGLASAGGFSKGLALVSDGILWSVELCGGTWAALDADEDNTGSSNAATSLALGAADFFSLRHFAACTDASKRSLR
eukprot:8177247-Pyramimonas_sp.AAC.1